MLEKFIENYLMRSNSAQNIYKDRICNGSAKDWEDYKHIVGRKFGLEEADNIIKSLYKDMIDRIDFKERKFENEPERY